MALRKLKLSNLELQSGQQHSRLLVFRRALLARLVRKVQLAQRAQQEPLARLV
jgi:hypothetical protein